VLLLRHDNPATRIHTRSVLETIAGHRRKPKSPLQSLGCGLEGPGNHEPPPAFDFPSPPPQNRGSSLQAHPTSGGVTASTEMLAARRHAGVHTPVIACKMIIANQQMAYAA
jgi:hypothetical protein